MPLRNAFSVLVAATASFAAVAAPQIVPADPVQFERLHLRVTVDSCSFDEHSVRIEWRDRTLVLHHQPLLCFVPGPPEVVDIQLGALPAGDYAVELRAQGADEPSERLTFQVSPLATAAIFPPLPFPIADYSGLWGAAGEPGWGLSLHQGARHLLFGALFVFDADRLPHWYTLQGGSWETSTRWRGQIVESDGSPWNAANYDAGSVHYVVIGSATLDFGMAPGQEGVARLSYRVDGHTVTRSISRFRL